MPQDLTPLRLLPGDDLRPALEAWTRRERIAAAFVVSGIGSLRDPALRFAGAPHPTVLPGEWEITSLSGSLSPDGARLEGYRFSREADPATGYPELRIHPTP